MTTIQSRAGGGETVSVSLRMPCSVRDDLKIQAIRSGRSLNTHVVMLLTQAVGAGDVPTS